MSDLLPEQVAPTTIRKLTVRSVGPYVRGAALDIRPLTILCGTNGSGKSIWIDVLRHFRELANLCCQNRPNYASLFCPRGTWFDSEMDVVFQRSLSTVIHDPTKASDLKRADSEDAFADARIGLLGGPRQAAVDYEKFGPPNCIGMTFTTERADIRLDDALRAVEDSPLTSDNPLSAMLNGDEIPVGTSIRLRHAMPDVPENWDSSFPLGGLESLLDICVDETWTIKLIAVPNSWRIDVSKNLLDSRSTDARSMVELGEVSPGYDKETGVPAFTDGTSKTGHTSKAIEHLANNIVLLFGQLLVLVTERVHVVGAIRLPFDPKKAGNTNSQGPTTEDKHADESNRSKYHVGENGSRTLDLLRSFSASILRQPVAPYTCFDHTFPTDFSFEKVNNVSWEHVLSLTKPELAEGWNSRDAPTEHEMNALRTAILNSALSHRNLLARAHSQQDSNEFPPPESVDENVLSEEARTLRKRGVENLAADEVARLHRLMLRQFDTTGDFSKQMSPAYSVINYLSYWLNRLTEVSWTAPYAGQTLPPFPAETPPPVGVVIHDILTTDSADFRGELLKKGLQSKFYGKEKYTGGGGLHLQSAGFHQLAPIVLQTAFQRVGDLMTVENPEVHLHPRLQRQVAEFFIEQAIPLDATGAVDNPNKWFLIETHSDLIVKRTLRAIVEERIPQSSVNIVFVHSEDAGSFSYAVAEPMKIDDRGQIENWPEGFLDESLKEADRMLDALYGSSDEQLNEEDPNE